MSTIRQLIDSRATQRPNDIFLVAPELGQELSCKELRLQAMSLADRLAQMGLSKESKVAFLLDNGMWTTLLFLGTMYSGRTIVALNAVAGSSQLEYVLQHSDSEVLFISEKYLDKFATAIAAVTRPVRIIPTNEDTGPDWPKDVAQTPSEDALPSVTEDDDALLIYTSGTTGVPKGVLLSQGNVTAGGNNTAVAHQLTPRDRALCVLPLYHINAEIVTVIAPLVSGGSVVMPRRFRASDFWQLIAEHKCTWASVVPTIVSYLLSHAEQDGSGAAGRQHLPHLRFSRSASAALPPEMHKAFEERFGIPLVETMGLSETAAQILSNPMSPGEMKYGSPGVPVGNEAKVINEDGTTASVGTIGELLIRGPNVMKCYYKNPEATKNTIDPDGWLHTGDLAYRDEDGFFFITGRIKELIIRGGENIAPREVDEILYQHPAVLEAAAFGMPDKHYGQEVMACVTLKPGANCTEDELKTHCQSALGDYKAPKRIWFMDELPKGPSGKVQRLKLADMVGADASMPNGTG